MLNSEFVSVSTTDNSNNFSDKAEIDIHHCQVQKKLAILSCLCAGTASYFFYQRGMRAVNFEEAFLSGFAFAGSGIIGSASVFCYADLRRKLKPILDLIQEYWRENPTLENEEMLHKLGISTVGLNF